MIIIDAKAALYHSYKIGTDPEAFISDEGNTINTAEYGFNQFMERYALPIFQEHPPIDVLICHDAGTDYRSALYPEYKQQKSRTEKDPAEKAETDKMFAMMKKFWAAMGCTQVRVQGVEADDLIALFCEKLEEPIHVYTVDADLLQLQGQHENVQVLLKCEFQESGEHNGIPYRLTSLAKSMLGDSSDNYGGVKGFGPAKWKELVEAYDYDGMEELEACVAANDYTVIEEVLAGAPTKALSMLYESRQAWRLGYQLAKLNPELCWRPRSGKLTHIEWVKRVPNWQQVASVFAACHCSDLLNHEAIQKWQPSKVLLAPEDVDEALYSEFAAQCEKSVVVAFDYETSPSPNAMAKDPKGKDYVDVKEAQITGASFTFGENLEQTLYVPVDHKDSANVDKSVLERMVKIAQSKASLAIQNLAFEAAVTKTNFGWWLNPAYDTQLMQSYADENEEAGLKAMSKRELGYNQASYADTVRDPETGEMRTMRELTADEVFDYGCDDAIVTAHLWVLQYLKMSIEGTLPFFEEYETCTVHNLVDAYLTGCEIDWPALQAIREKDEATIAENDARLREILTEHCAAPNEAAAKKFVAEEREWITAQAKAKARDWLSNNSIDLATEEAAKHLSDAVNDAVSKFTAKAVEGSFYTPYTVAHEEAEFLPTATQFEKLTTHLGFVTPLAAVTQKAMREWLAAAADIDMESETGSISTLTSDQQLFCDLLAEAYPQINKRTGDEYDRLIRFCQSRSPAEGKVITTGDELNTGSPIQMQHLLYCKLGLPVRLKNLAKQDTGRGDAGVDGSPQTDDLAIQTAMAEDAPEGSWQREALQCVLNIKSAKTRISLYHDPYPKWRHPTDNRIHPQVRDCGTVTRRPSGTSPNILQVSKHQEDGVMRSIFLPYEEDSVIVSIDFSQQELRIMASESGDENLISCYIGDNRRDVHSMTASGIAKVSYEQFIEAYGDPDHPRHVELSKVRKRPAKATNFLMAYLGTAVTLSQRLIIPYDEADSMLEAAFKTYPKVRPWQDEVIQFARKHGYTQTAYGNRRHASNDLFSSNDSVRRRMERQLTNHTIQGTAADILKIVLTNCWKTNLWVETGAKLLGPVYDELVSSVPIRHVVEYIDRLVEIMEVTPPGHIVPMEADVSLGANWRDQIEIGVRPSAEKIMAAVEKAVGGAK